MDLSENQCELGFSLIELVTALAVGGVFVLGLVQVFQSQAHGFEQQQLVLKAQQEARVGFQVVFRELRGTGLDPTGGAGAGIIEAEGGSIRFTADLNGDGDVADLDEDIKYTSLDADQDGTLDLGRSTDGGATYETVVGGIVSLGFRYTLADGTETTTPSSLSLIRKVKIKVVCHDPDGEGAPFPYEGLCGLRNRLIGAKAN